MTIAIHPLPDPDATLVSARDFIMQSYLGRKALRSGLAGFPLFLSDLITRIHYLAKSCHLPEFTDHGLPHLCSLVDRISNWSQAATKPTLVDTLSGPEAAELLIATLIHDLGMLSHRPADLSPEADESSRRELWSDEASWVRRTHVDRLPKLMERLFVESEHEAILSEDWFRRTVWIAQAHQKWPWEWQPSPIIAARHHGLAAVVAVVDLLDEDAERCDTATLLNHRNGTTENRAHWLRHALTLERLQIRAGELRVTFGNLDDTHRELAPVFGALRNHFRLIELYRDDLARLDVSIDLLTFDPCTGVSSRAVSPKIEWQQHPGFATASALCSQLLKTFMKEALFDDRRLSSDAISHLRKASLEIVDLTPLRETESDEEPRSAEEQVFHSLLRK